MVVLGNLKMWSFASTRGVGHVQARFPESPRAKLMRRLVGSVFESNRRPYPLGEQALRLLGYTRRCAKRRHSPGRRQLGSSRIRTPASRPRRPPFDNVASYSIRQWLRLHWSVHQAWRDYARLKRIEER